MEDDGEPCYYFSKKLPPDLVSFCRAFNQNLINPQTKTQPPITADVWIKYYSQLAQKKQAQKRSTPPVPKFDEPYKKIKLNTEINFTNSPSLNTAPLDGNPTRYTFSNALGLSREGSEEHTIDNSQSNTNSMVKLIETIPESRSLSQVLSASSSQSKTKQKFQEKMEQKQNQGEFTQSPQSEEKQDKCSLKDSFFRSEPIKNAMTSSSAQSLDKKDLKKLEKFLECLNDFKQNLNLDNHLVEGKFKELATIAIPKLLTHFKSKPFEAVAAAILLYACREVDYPITIKQIVSASNTKEKLINKCIFSLKEILPNDAEVKHFRAGEFIRVLAEKLKVKDNVRIAANKIWENIEKLNFVKSIHAVTLAACCLKFACCLSDDDREFEAIAIAAGITKMTLKNMYRDLFPYRFYFITVDCMLRDPQELKQI